MTFAAVCVTATAVAVITFYKVTNVVAVHKSQSIGIPLANNSIRHAIAAAETYAGLRLIGAPDWLAEKTTIKLGYLNEYMESTFKRNKDSTREVYKDLFNNMSGITAAKWAETCPPSFGHQGRLSLVAGLATRRVLPYVRTDARLPNLPDGTNVRAAIRQFKADQGSIIKAISMHLDRDSPECSEQRL